MSAPTPERPSIEWLEAVRRATDDLAARTLGDPATSPEMAAAARRHLARSRPWSAFEADLRALPPEKLLALRAILFSDRDPK